MASVVYARYGVGTTDIGLDGAVPRRPRRPRTCGSCLATIEAGEVCVERLAGGRSFCLRCIRGDATHFLTGGVEIALDVADTGALGP